MAGGEALASGWGGGWRRWHCEFGTKIGNENWTEIPGVGGHRGPVRGLDWSPKGEYLISTGLANPLSEFLSSNCTIP
jgi:elongator complex protein 2